MSKEIIAEKIDLILESISIIHERMSKINSADQFVSSPFGIMLLDSIVIRLQIIGEQTKGIDKLDKLLLPKFPSVEWNKIMRLRDLISHHYEDIDYEDIDYEIVFQICKNELPRLTNELQKIKLELRDT
ncbi:MAG: toxin-antitoxin system antitoxin subunit [Ignavibacteria bacterium CG22_combo_CG10-13_8_21_14_all_37_15]|nr:MAG: toxin-antitoxin system antitoxin subunit [Ignavibacteria bacterium CG22_combo_CG10-13_8_21_14_all_37_15]PJC61037.1 MAG: toxin-antitoxin system antitoxin subunit [Ignavibacteria bacterium CG_4_9_14_0_2_um_filter_37_13]